MFESIFGTVALIIAITGGILSFGFVRGFVRRRLRFVDAVRSPLVPYLAGGIGLLVTAPFTFLPLITGATVAAVGLGAGLGARSGVTAIRRGDVTTYR